MAFPEDLVLVTVTGTILHPSDGSPATGGVLFAIPQPLTDTEGHVIVGNTPIMATLRDGSFSVRLPATDQAQVRPVGWAYTITVSTDAGGLTFQAALPSTPSTVTLDALTPVVTPPAVGAYVPLTEVGQPGGVASLDGAGKVSASQLPTAVQSVTAADGTIIVGGTSTAPTVRVGSVAESQVTGLVSDLAAKYTKPGAGIPSTDMATAVQMSLGLANTSVQSVTAADGTVTIGGTATAPTVRAVTGTTAGTLAARPQCIHLDHVQRRARLAVVRQLARRFGPPPTPRPTICSFAASTAAESYCLASPWRPGTAFSPARRTQLRATAALARPRRPAMSAVVQSSLSIRQLPKWPRRPKRPKTRTAILRPKRIE